MREMSSLPPSRKKYDDPNWKSAGLGGGKIISSAFSSTPTRFVRYSPDATYLLAPNEGRSYAHIDVRVVVCGGYVVSVPLSQRYQLYLLFGVAPDKFYTLPNRKKKVYSSGSIDRRVKRRGSLELTPPEKPPRTFAASTAPQSTHKTSIFDIFKREKKAEPKKSNLRRSVSDASNLKSKVYGPNHVQPLRKRSGSDEELAHGSRNPKKQLSPIIEVTQREDYFSQADPDHDKENVNDENLDIRSPVRKKNKKESVTDQLKEYIDEVDAALYKETGIRVSSPKEEVKSPQPIIIDVDKAEKISEKNKKFKDSLIGKKLKSITHKKNKSNEAKSKAKKSSAKNRTADTKSKSENQAKPEVKEEEEKPTQEEKPFSGPISASPKIKEAVENFEKLNKTSPTMIHSSQKPVDKLPLTKGRTVNSMIKQLSSDSRSPPPPRTSVLITPHGSVQHNNNQPFSYTRGISPEKYMSNENLPNPTSPIIYAQVVCGSNGAGQPKQTVHTAYTNGKKHPHSDSDEGLGGEENSGFSRLEKTVTHFGDDSYNDDSYRKNPLDDYFDEDKFEEESPITPKFRSPTYLNGFSGYERKLSEFSRIEQSGYIDSSSRGRGDGMDAKRRESLTENENGFIAKTPNGRSDLSARRDLLESRIKNRLTDKIRTSPEYTQNTTPTNVYISESTSKYYRGGSASPIGYTEKYISETKTDKYGKPQKYESRSKQYFGDRKDSIEYELRGKPNTYQYNGFDSEPKSFDSQISDYRSSPENRHFESSHNKSNGRYVERTEKQKMFKDREVYKSTPEIHQRSYQETKYHDSYHDSLRRDKMENRMTSSSKYKSERYLDQSENERKDKFGDSGIENDFRRDSGENFRVTRPPKSRREYCNDSEDEGFASSLLIASERQHTEDSINQRKRNDYDSDRTYSREDDSYRQLESMDYKSKIRNQEYVPRERSIDDGSHYDPRIDKEVDRSTLKRVDKKPPKPEKKSGLEKVKSLFTRDSKKKKEKQQAAMVREESLRARYVEYKGRDTVDAKYKKKEANEVQTVSPHN
ncbi:hypothetical protein NQ318_018668 [Aromia moschata]|uniref:Uncharacterized protein n=1 Tax=Aromia moschata TaxID=1265417 RepID=A0AAV8ZI74_9CUCU|nr:hypothetical protein NQ318_018668 [Aromia moschata]